MLQQLISAILIVCLLASTVCAGMDYVAAERHETGGCSITSGADRSTHPCHDHDGASHSEHCCDTHTHLSAITVHEPDVTHPIHEKQFTAIIPHLTPQDFSRIPFIPPRTLS